MNRLKELNQILDNEFSPNWIDELINDDDNLDNFKLSLRKKEVDLGNIFKYKMSHVEN